MYIHVTFMNEDILINQYIVEIKVFKVHNRSWRNDIIIIYVTTSRTQQSITTSFIQTKIDRK